MSLFNRLKSIRRVFQEAGVNPYTPGLTLKEISAFQNNKDLNLAVERAAELFPVLLEKYSDIYKLGEQELAPKLQDQFLQFYDPVSVSPYVPIAAQGPWIITHTGAVIYDAGGYGMLGFGHTPLSVLDSMSKPTVQANIMTPSFSQLDFAKAFDKEVGHTRKKNPYRGIACLNSGSEALTLALRISDAYAKQATAPGTRFAGRQSVVIHLTGSFHGRTDRPASVSGSSYKSYESHLKSYEGGNPVVTYNVEINDSDALRAIYKQLDDEGKHVECVIFEPCMGEGNPGVLIQREFYDIARQLTKEYDSFLIVDSVQAGIRAQGTLSFLDYPGFQTAECPDIEAYSKALNAGQYPLSVLGLSERGYNAYKKGLHGNTMTTNPRALNTAVTVLNQITPELRKNIVERGEHFQSELLTLQKDFPEVLSHVTGSGLLVAAHIKEPYSADGKPTSIEHISRRNGVNVIHGGKNAIRFTPVFNMSENEVDLVVQNLKKSFKDHTIATGFAPPPSKEAKSDFYDI